MREIITVIADDRKLILTLHNNWQSAAHNARVWSESQWKAKIESCRNFCLAGDFVYPISDVLTKPYSIAEAIVDIRSNFSLLDHVDCALKCLKICLGFGRKDFPF
jgi:hypothetical protein